MCVNGDMKRAVASEQVLVRDMLAGSERAFAEFFETYFPRLYRFALPRLKNDADATKEVVQATLIKAMRNLSGYRGEAALMTWVAQICRRQIVDHLRAQQRHASHVVLLEDSDEMRAAFQAIEAPAEDEPMHSYSSAETRRLVQSVLDSLPARYGDVLEWKYVEGQSVEEIGARLGIGHTAAQSVLARARAAFRDALDTVLGASAVDVLAIIRSGTST